MKLNFSLPWVRPLAWVPIYFNSITYGRDWRPSFFLPYCIFLTALTMLFLSASVSPTALIMIPCFILILLFFVLHFNIACFSSFLTVFRYTLCRGFTILPLTGPLPRCGQMKYSIFKVPPLELPRFRLLPPAACYLLPIVIFWLPLYTVFAGPRQGQVNRKGGYCQNAE